MEQKPANTGLRSQYSLRLYSWANKYVEDGAKTILLEELRRVLGLESIKHPDGNVIREAPPDIGEPPESLVPQPLIPMSCRLRV
jgi:hypothetical protein